VWDGKYLWKGRQAVALNLIWGEHWRKPGGESGGGAANEE